MADCSYTLSNPDSIEQPVRVMTMETIEKLIF